MKIYSKIFVFILAPFLSCTVKDKYDPAQYLSKQDQDSLVYQTLRYSAKLPPTATHENKFSHTFNSYYKSLMSDHELKHYYVSDTINFFLITRQARSITPMREGIGGKIKIDTTGKIIVYEEVFRTWKMNIDSLETRGKNLFDIMVNGQDLSRYYSKYKRDQYIEYPDGRFYFDRVERRWHDRELDSLILK
jgi:hypothetical protein